MLYPSPIQYLQTLSGSSEMMRTLTDVSVALGFDGEPVVSNGNFGAVFKINHGEQQQTAALKCFTREQGGRYMAYQAIANAINSSRSEYIIDYKLLDQEIFVFDNGLDSGRYYPLLLMEWVQGQTLSQGIARAAMGGDKERLADYSHRFDTMALWLLEQDFAHGDLKPDNIMVTEDGGFVLVDYDGMFIPSMAGERQREGGTAGFQHPLRAQMSFGKSIDDYSIAIISFSLRALALFPELYRADRDVLLMNPEDIIAGKDDIYNALKESQIASTNLYEALISPTPVIDSLSAMIDPQATQPLTVDVPFYENLAAVKKEGRWGYINSKCIFVIPPIFEQAGHFACGLAPVKLAGKWGFIDNTARAIVPMKYDNAWSFTDQGLALVRKGDKYGYVDTQGKLKIPIRYDFAQNFSEGYACVMVNDKYGFIDPRGRYFIQPTYDYAQNVRDGQAYVEKENHNFYIKFFKQP